MQRERAEVVRRERAYRANRPPVAVKGQIVILVDDGLATGSTMHAAVLAVRRLGPAGIVVAVPVGSRQTCDALTDVADDVVCALMPEPFTAVGLWYRRLLRDHRRRGAPAARTADHRCPDQRSA